MKTTRQQRRRTGEVSTRSNTSTGICNTRGKTSVKRTGGQQHKARGKSEISLVGKDEPPVSSKTAQVLHQLSPEKGINVVETKNNVLELGSILQSPVKIKLQLFPVDEGTRTRLEKDGHNPHLELTLKGRKKICSVVKHLNSKWGGSSIAVGELMLFPYSIQRENLVAYQRWTLKDTDTSAADVYTAIGRPDIFRLRYGWFSNLEHNAIHVPVTSGGFEDCSESEDIKKGFSKNVEIIDAEKKTYEDKSRTNNGITLSSLPWADCLTNISIGGLLSEASLQGNASRDPMPIGNDLCLQQNPFISDSFDAAIAALIHGRPQGPKPSSHGSHSSILDAEETCHAFTFQNLSSPNKKVNASSRSAPCGTSSRDSSSKLFKIPNSIEVGAQAGVTQEDAPQEPKADLLPQTQVDNTESNLGMAGINWSDSLGPLDLGLSSSRQIINGDSISFSGLFASSLDAFQSCSFFARDGKVPPT